MEECVRQQVLSSIMIIKSYAFVIKTSCFWYKIRDKFNFISWKWFCFSLRPGLMQLSSCSAWKMRLLLTPFILTTLKCRTIGTQIYPSFLLEAKVRFVVFRVFVFFTCNIGLHIFSVVVILTRYYRIFTSEICLCRISQLKQLTVWF